MPLATLASVLARLHLAASKVSGGDAWPAIDPRNFLMKAVAFLLLIA
jgi:hypothetical protein